LFSTLALAPEERENRAPFPAQNLTWDRYVVTPLMQTLVDEIVAMGTERDLDD
jgi:hypothetical protein